MTDRERAIYTVLVFLRTPLMAVSKLSREDAFQLAKEHGLTVEDLLELAVRSARSR